MRHDLYGTGFVGLGVSVGLVDKSIITVISHGIQTNVTRSRTTVRSAVAVHAKTLQYDCTYKIIIYIYLWVISMRNIWAHMTF